MVENRTGLNREKDVVGRRVDFTQNLPLAWGIEVELPIDGLEKERLYQKLNIKIPEHIDTFKYLDLCPQESLYPDYRNIGKRESWQYTNLDNLVSGGRSSKRAEMNRRKAIEELFFLVFGNNGTEKEKFSTLIAESSGNTILAVEGHSWDLPWEIGEHASFDPEKHEERKFQKTGNDVPVWRIIKKYNEAKDITLAYPVGEVNGGRSLAGLLPTVVVAPRQK